MKQRGKILFLALAFAFIIISLSNFSQAGTLKVTEEHPFLINGSWVSASDLKVGDELTTIDGKKVRITSIEDVETKEPFPVYNLEAEVYHDFVVDGGDGLGVVVHNSNFEANILESRNIGEIPGAPFDREYLMVVSEGIDKPTIVFSSRNRLDIEQIWAKISGKPYLDISTGATRASVSPNLKILKSYLKASGTYNYKLIHVHPLEPGELSLPSPQDLLGFVKGRFTSKGTLRVMYSKLPSWLRFSKDFLRESEQTVEIIFQQSPKTGEIGGFYFIRKTEAFQDLKAYQLAQGTFNQKLNLRVRDYWNALASDDPSLRSSGLEDFANAYYLQIKTVPSPGYTYQPGIGFIKD